VLLSQEVRCCGCISCGGQEKLAEEKTWGDVMDAVVKGIVEIMKKWPRWLQILIVVLVLVIEFFYIYRVTQPSNTTTANATHGGAAAAGNGSASAQDCGFSIFGNNNCNTVPQQTTEKNPNAENEQARPHDTDVKANSLVAEKMEGQDIPTLKDFFENDWPNLPAYYQVSAANFKALRDPTQSYRGEFAWRLIGDYESQARFLAIYLAPDISPFEATLICNFVAGNYHFLLESADSAIEMTFKKPAETATTHFKDMVFSKRVFIYYGNLDFSEIQKGEIEASFQKQGLSVGFRTNDYAWEHHKNKMVRRAAPLTPNSVSLPDAKLVPGIQIFAYNPGHPKSSFQGTMYINSTR
jgi:hypothetical protein